MSDMTNSAIDSSNVLMLIAVSDEPQFGQSGCASVRAFSTVDDSGMRVPIGCSTKQIWIRVTCRNWIRGDSTVVELFPAGFSWLSV